MGYVLRFEKSEFKTAHTDKLRNKVKMSVFEDSNRNCISSQTENFKLLDKQTYIIIANSYTHHIKIGDRSLNFIVRTSSKLNI